MKILCSISTKNRYDNYLPMALMSVINQTRKVDHLTIYDDNDAPRDLRESEVYVHLFRLMDEKWGSGKWDVTSTDKKGQHYNHQRGNTTPGYDAVWRIDDDTVAEPDVLEKLEAQMVEGVGAVGGSVLTPPVYPAPMCATKIADIYTKPNRQWFRIDKTEEIEHLHCSFLYRTGIANYDLRLSKKAHREETMFTYAIKLKGYRVLITPCITYHLKSQSGGIRSDNDKRDYDHDEAIFRGWLGFKETKKRLYVLNNGLGDHLQFLQAITPEPDATVACCYPEILTRAGHKNLVSIAQAQQMVNVDDYDVYAWAGRRQWKGTLIDAFREMYRSL